MPEGLEKNYVIISEKMDDFLISDSYRHVGDKMLLLSPNNNKWEYYEILYRISHENFPDGIKQGYFIYSISK